MGNRTMAGASVSVVSRRSTTETQNSTSRQSVSENPQLIPVESSSLASGS